MCVHRYWAKQTRPSHSVSYGGLQGYNVVGTVHTHQEGAAPVGGSFKLMFQGYGPSVAIPVDATASMMHDALLTIPSIDDVQVWCMLMCMCTLHLYLHLYLPHAVPCHAACAAPPPPPPPHSATSTQRPVLYPCCPRTRVVCVRAFACARMFASVCTFFASIVACTARAR